MLFSYHNDFTPNSLSIVVRVKSLNTTPQLQHNFTIVKDLLFSLLENNPIFSLQKNKLLFVQFLQLL